MSRAKHITPAEAVHAHERNMHAGKPLTKMKDGGEVMIRKDTRMVDPKGMGMGPRTVKPPLPQQASPTAVAARSGQAKPVARPVSPGGGALKKGGKVACMAMGGVAKIRHNQASKSGKPIAGAQKKFRGNVI